MSNSPKKNKAKAEGKTEAKTALTQKATSPPAKAEAVTPAIKNVGTVVVKEQAKAPAVKEASAVALKEQAQTPAVKESATVAVKEQAKTPAVKESGTVAVRETPEKKAGEKAGGKASSSPRELTPLVAPSVLPGPGHNPYEPYTATVADVIRETHNIVTLRLVLDDAEAMKNFHYDPGQVGQVSVFGAGESTFVINSPPSQKEYLQFSVMRTGEVTEAIHQLAPGDKVGVRAPLGKGFPVDQWRGKDIFFVGGGIGMAPIRTVMLHLLECKADYGKISLLYGARSPRDMAYSYELEDWMGRPDLDCTLTIDNPFEGWAHKVGLIPNVLLELAPDPAKTIAVLCGPPIMIKFTVQALQKLNFPDESIITTLEKRMKCGIGICGRCNIGAKYVCVDGPVFSWAELKELPPDM